MPGVCFCGFMFVCYRYDQANMAPGVCCWLAEVHRVLGAKNRATALLRVGLASKQIALVPIKRHFAMLALARDLD